MHCFYFTGVKSEFSSVTAAVRPTWNQSGRKKNTAQAQKHTKRREGGSLGTLTVWAFKNIKAVFDHYFFTVMRQISFFLFFLFQAEKIKKTQLSCGAFKKSSCLIDHCANRPNWISPKLRILLTQKKKEKKVTGLWCQPANKPIMKCFIREAITGNTDGIHRTNTRRLEPNKETNGGSWRDARTRKEGREKKK